MDVDGNDPAPVEPVSEAAAKPDRVLPPAAQRALAEAAARRSRPEPERPPEFNGRKGPDPVRYGDWEVNGIASDF
jgi:hypothetical protein